MEIQGEYWIIDGSAHYADGDNGDKNHEMFAYDHIASQNIRAVYNFAKTLGGTLPSLHSLENEEEVAGSMQELVGYVEKTLFKTPDPNHPNLPLFKTNNEIKNEISKKTGIDIETINILTYFSSGMPTSTDARVYMMKREGWIVVRNNNIELYGLDQSKIKNLIKGLDEVLEQEGADDSVLDSEVEFNLFDFKSNKSSDVTLEDIKNNSLFRPQQLPVTTYNRSLFVPTGKQYGRELWRGTSESSLMLSFREWIK